MDFLKDPDAVLDYGFDWSNWLQTGETISTSNWTVPSGLTEDSASNTATETKVWLSGGTDSKLYGITNHITTSAGREDDRTLSIRVKNR